MGQLPIYNRRAAHPNLLVFKLCISNSRLSWLSFTSLHLPVTSSVAAPLSFWVTHFIPGTSYCLYTGLLCLSRSRDLGTVFSHLTSDTGQDRDLYLLLPYLPIKSCLLLFSVLLINIWLPSKFMKNTITSYTITDRFFSLKSSE